MQSYPQSFSWNAWGVAAVGHVITHIPCPLLCFSLEADSWWVLKIYEDLYSGKGKALGKRARSGSAHEGNWRGLICNNQSKGRWKYCPQGSLRWAVKIQGYNVPCLMRTLIALRICLWTSVQLCDERVLHVNLRSCSGGLGACAGSVLCINLLSSLG